MENGVRRSLLFLYALVVVIFNCDVYRSFGAFVLFCTVVVPAFGQTSVLTQHNDNARTGQNTSETILNTTNVNVNQFGKLFAMPVGRPSICPAPLRAGRHHQWRRSQRCDLRHGKRQRLCLRCRLQLASLLWKASMVDAAHGAGAGETALNSATTTGCGDMQPQVGITSTPVIDPTSKTIYVEAKSTNGTNYFHRLHALDLLTGNEKTPGPVVIAATVSGTGDGSSNGQIAFDNLHHLNRPGLLASQRHDLYCLCVALRHQSLSWMAVCLRCGDVHTEERVRDHAQRRAGRILDERSRRGGGCERKYLYRIRKWRLRYDQRSGDGNGRHDIETRHHQPDSDAAGLLHTRGSGKPGYGTTSIWDRAACCYCRTSQAHSRTSWWKREKRGESTSSIGIR